MASKQTKKLQLPVISKKWLVTLFGLILLSGLVILAANGVGNEPILPIKYVRVEGDLRYVDREEIRAEIEPLLEKSFLALDMKTVRQSLENLPWVDSVRVARLWPDTLQVNLVEQTPYVKWGESGYLNRHGEPFLSAGRTITERLPKLFGQPGQEKSLLAQFERLSEALAQKEMALEAFRVTDRQAWQLVLKNQTEIFLGRDQPQQAFDRLIHAVSLLGKERLERISRIDMRYPNGFAVQWSARTKEG